MSTEYYKWYIIAEEGRGWMKSVCSPSLSPFYRHFCIVVLVFAVGLSDGSRSSASPVWDDAGFRGRGCLSGREPGSSGASHGLRGEDQGRGQRDGEQAVGESRWAARQVIPYSTFWWLAFFCRIRREKIKLNRFNTKALDWWILSVPREYRELSATIRDSYLILPDLCYLPF